jgi:hypothetical protein
MVRARANPGDVERPLLESGTRRPLKGPCRFLRLRVAGGDFKQPGTTKGATNRLTAPAYWKFESISLQR